VSPRGPATLLASLQSQRRHVLGSLEGLDDDALRRTVLPTGWSLLAMVRHLTFDIERFWFEAVVAGDQAMIDEVAAAAPDHGWLVPDDQPASAVLDAYRQAAERSDAIVTARALDTAPAWWPTELFGTFRLDTLEEVLVHVIAETACHAGHLDVARELLDGTTWLILT
jgi:uncharacterized damage-inducible protein DinB